MNILKDKVIVVVGASSGIGAAISEYFCDHGAITCIFGRRKERLEKLCDRAKEKNQRMYPYTGDARNYSNLARMAEQIVGCFGKIDVWINCAGQNKAIGCLWDLDPENLWMETEVVNRMFLRQHIQPAKLPLPVLRSRLHWKSRRQDSI